MPYKDCPVEPTSVLSFHQHYAFSGSSTWKLQALGAGGLYKVHSPTPSLHCLHPPVSPHFPQVVLLLLYTEERSNREHLNLLPPKYSHPCTLTDALCPSNDVDGVNPSFCAQDPLPPPSSLYRVLPTSSASSMLLSLSYPHSNIKAKQSKIYLSPTSPATLSLCYAPQPS